MDHKTTPNCRVHAPSFDDFDLLDGPIATSGQDDKDCFLNCDPLTANYGLTAGEMNMAFKDQEETSGEVRVVEASSNDDNSIDSSHKGRPMSLMNIGSASNSSTGRGIRQKRRVGGRAKTTAVRTQLCSIDDGLDEKPSLHVLVERLIGLDTVNQNTNILCAQILNHPDVMTQPGVLPLYRSYNGKHCCF